MRTGTIILFWGTIWIWKYWSSERSKPMQMTTSVHISDSEAIAGCPRDLKIKATKGNCIVWFMPYRKAGGFLEIPENAKPESVEGVVIHDNSGHFLDPGVVVGCKRAGDNFTYQGHELSRIPEDALVLVDTGFSPEIE